MARYEYYATFHVMLGKRRTTVSLDKILSELLSLKLGTVPNREDAHSAIRLYLQQKLDEAKDPGRAYMSQWLAGEALLDLVDKELSKKYWKWVSTW